MLITDYQARKLLKPLYHTAEKDRNDVIANAASALAVRLEQPKRAYVLSEIDQRLIRYARSHMPQVEAEQKPRRKTYKRRVSLA